MVVLIASAAGGCSDSLPAAGPADAASSDHVDQGTAQDRRDAGVLDTSLWDGPGPTDAVHAGDTVHAGDAGAIVSEAGLVSSDGAATSGEAGLVSGDAAGDVPRWETLKQSVHGSDLVSDGHTLYRVGGAGDWCQKLSRYDGREQDTWTILTDANPQCYAHQSPGEGNRSWYYDNKIVVAGTSAVGHPGGDIVTIYDIGQDAWTKHDLPVFDHFSYGQQSALNAQTGEAYIVWAEKDTTHQYASAALDLRSETWGTTVDRNGPIGASPFGAVLEDSSSQYVFDLVQADRYVALGIYDLSKVPGDFSGTWRASSVFDLGANATPIDSAKNGGTDMMAWDPSAGRLFVVAGDTGATLEYTPATDTWRELPARPVGITYRDTHLAIADGWLYSQNGADLWALHVGSS